MDKWARLPKVRFHLALAYLIWSILPHYHLLVHSHPGGDGAHTHLSFSAAEVGLANRALEALGPAVLAGDTRAEFSLEPGDAAAGKASVAAHAIAGETALAGSTGDGNPHSHYWEDANLAGILSLCFAGLLIVLAIPYILRRHPAPFSGRLGLTWARGPPLLSPA